VTSQRFSSQSWALALGLVFAAASRLVAAEQVQDIPTNWVSTEMRRLSVAEPLASSTFSPEGGQYLPARAVDGQRGTKWVASIAPSPEKPQWIDLRLFGTQEVIAVAVFGESVDNDGILDVRVQVAGSKAAEFTTVAAVEGMESPRWLATFDPVKTTTVRLLITRSGGPSTHTDVYEIEVFGRPMSGGELKDYGADRLRRCAARLKELLARAEKLGLTSDLGLAGLTRTIASIDGDQRSLAESFSKWETLGEPARQSLVAQIERLEVRVERLISGLVRVASVWTERVENLSAARKTAEKAAAGENVVTARMGTRLRLANHRVSVVLDEADGSWEATWLGNVNAAVRRMQFAVEAGDHKLSPASAKAEAANFTDALGSGLEIRQRWGNGIEVDRRIRLYHGSPAVFLSAEITNRSNRDITLGPVKMFHLSETDGGWWHLSDPISSPSAAGYSGASPPCRPSPDEESSAGTDTQYGSTGVLALSQEGSPGGMVLGFLSAREGSPSVGARFRVCEGGTSLDAVLNLGGRILPAGESMAVDPVWLSVEESNFDALEHYGDAVAALAPKPVRTGANALWCSWYPIRMGINEEIVLEHAAIAAKHFRPLGLQVIQLDHGWQRGDVCGDWVPNERFPHGLGWLSDQLQSRYGMKLGLWIAPTQVALSSQLFQRFRSLGGEVSRPARRARRAHPCAAHRKDSPDPSAAGAPQGHRHEHASVGRVSRDQASELGRRKTPAFRAVPASGRLGGESVPVRSGRSPAPAGRPRNPRSRPPDARQRQPLGTRRRIQRAAAGLVNRLRPDKTVIDFLPCRSADRTITWKHLPTSERGLPNHGELSWTDIANGLPTNRPLGGRLRHNSPNCLICRRSHGEIVF
jgi:hypothetical protein